MDSDFPQWFEGRDREYDGLRGRPTAQSRDHRFRFAGYCNPRREAPSLRRDGGHRTTQPRHRNWTDGSCSGSRQKTHDQHHGRRHAFLQLRGTDPSNRLYVRKSEGWCLQYSWTIYARRYDFRSGADLGSLGTQRAIRHRFPRPGDGGGNCRQPHAWSLCPADCC